MPALDKKTLRRIFFCVLGCIVVYWLLFNTDRVKVFFGTISNIFAPFILGGVLAFILNVPTRAIENRILGKIKKTTAKRILAVLLTFIALLMVISVVFWLLIPRLVDTVGSLIPALSNFSEEAREFVSNFMSKNPELMKWIEGNVDFSSIKFSSSAQNNMGNLFGSAISAIGGVFSAVFDTVIGLVFCVYCLFQKETLARQGKKILYAFTKESTADKVVRIFRLTDEAFSNFLSGQCVEVCILGVMFAVGMAIFRMPYIPLICVLIAISAFIPIIGAWVGCVLGTFLIFVESPMLALIFVAMFLVIQLIENNVIYPRVVGTSVGLSGMWVLLAVVVGGDLFGVVGMFLMIPLASVLHTILKEVVNQKLKDSNVSTEKLMPLDSEQPKKRESKKNNIEENNEEQKSL